MRTITQLIFILILTCFMLSCSQSLEEAFKKAENANTIISYEQFLKKFPDSQYSTQAKKMIEELRWVGKKILFEDTITIQGSSGSWLLDMAAKDIMQSRYIATFGAVVEAVLGDSLKVIITGYKVDMLTTNGRTSPAQHENLSQAQAMASQMVGQTLVIEKSIAKKSD